MVFSGSCCNLKLPVLLGRTAKLIVFALILLATAIPARAAATEETPEKALLRYMAKLQEGKSMLVIIDDVDWETAYTLFPVERHNSILHATQVNNAADLRNFFIEIFGDPKIRVEKIRQRMIKEVSSHGLKPDNIEDNITGVETVFARFQASLQAMIQLSTFKTGTVKIEEPKAYVELLTTRSGITTSKQITLVRKDGRWMLTEPNLITMKGQKVIPPGMGKPGANQSGMVPPGMVPPGMVRPGQGPYGPSPGAGPVIGDKEAIAK